MASQQQLVDSNIADILKLLVLDELSISLVDLLETHMMSPRQIAMKITSLSSATPLSIVDLNLMFYGQDLSKVVTPYIPYVSETEDMVNYDTDYTPVDIRDMIKDKINDLKIEVKSALQSIQKIIPELDISVKNATQLFASAIISIPLFISQSVPNPTAARSIALLCHNAVSVIKITISTIIVFLPILTSSMNIPSSNIKTPAPTTPTPSISGYRAPKVGTLAPTVGIPKLSLLLNEQDVDKILIPLNVFLETLKTITEAVVAMDITLKIIDAATAVVPATYP